MNHKRKRHPNARAGCKMCKPYKQVSGWKGLSERRLGGAGGFGKIRNLIYAKQDMEMV
jgi:hypothetical protein